MGPNKSGRYEVYVTRFPDVDIERRISADGGGFPIWIRDGIYYVTYNNELMYVKSEMKGSGINFDTPQLLFDADQFGVQLAGYQDVKYTIKADGSEIIAVYAPQSTTFYYVLIDNWFEEYRNKNN